MKMQPLDQLREIIENALSDTTNLRKNFVSFFIETMILYLSTRLFHLKSHARFQNIPIL
jgi:hypothetical protein